MRRIPALDGVRGLAAAGIVLGHGLGRDGMRIGVDVFFVLSGFLITSLLLDEIVRTGTVDIAGFCMRRARRLLPPLIPVVIVGGLISGGAIGTLASVLYLQNFFALAGSAIGHDVLSHTWSLSIEEHFYLVWPPILLLVHRRWGADAALATAVTGTLASLAERIVLIAMHAAGDRFYFADDMRASSVLLGCTVALLAHTDRLPVVGGRLAALAVVPLVILGSSVAPFLAATATDTVIAGVCAAVVIAHLARSRCMPLQHRTLRHLGRISYALYLWHYVIVCILFSVGIGTGPTMLLLAGGGGFVLALLSDRLIEEPLRRRYTSRRLSRAPVAAVA